MEEKTTLNTIEVHLSRSYKQIMGCGGVLSLGLVPLMMWVSAMNWPRLLDDEGITLRSGKRLSWDMLTDIRRVTVVDAETGARVTGRLELVFGRITAKVVPHSLQEGQEVLSFLTRVLGQDLQAG